MMGWSLNLTLCAKKPLQRMHFYRKLFFFKRWWSFYSYVLFMFYWIVFFLPLFSWYGSVRRTGSRPYPEWSDRTRSVQDVEQDKNWSYHNRAVLSSHSSGCLRPATDMSCPPAGPTEAVEFCLSRLPPAFSTDDFVSFDSDYCSYHCHYYFCVSQYVSVGWVSDCWQ